MNKSCLQFLVLNWKLDFWSNKLKNNKVVKKKSVSWESFINVRFLANVILMSDFVTNKNTKFLLITESLMSLIDQILLNKACSLDYVHIQQPRISGHCVEAAVCLEHFMFLYLAWKKTAFEILNFVILPPLPMRFFSFHSHFLISPWAHCFCQVLSGQLS